MFEHLVDALVHGSGYERIATEACSDATMRRRLRQWAGAGIAEQVHAIALAAYDQIIGLQLTDIAADGCITKAPCGGDKAGPSPVDRRKGGLKRSVATEGRGVPLGIVSAGANRHDSPLLAPTLHAATGQVGPHWPKQVTVHLDAGYDSGVTRTLLDGLGLHGETARKGVPAPVQVGKRWVCERTHSWMNGYGKLRRCTDRDGRIVDFYLYLAACLGVRAVRAARPLRRGVMVLIPDATPEDGQFTPMSATYVRVLVEEGHLPWPVLLRFVRLVEQSGGIVPDAQVETGAGELHLSCNAWHFADQAFEVNSSYFGEHDCWCYELYEVDPADTENKYLAVRIPDLQPAGGPFAPAAPERVTFAAHGSWTLPWPVFRHFLNAIEASGDIVDGVPAMIGAQPAPVPNALP